MSTDTDDAGDQYVRGPAHDSTPPGRYINGHGYAYYQVRAGGERHTVQEHQLVALLHGADPYKLFSDGDYHVHHAMRIEAVDEHHDAAQVLRRFNYGANLSVEKEEDHLRETNLVGGDAV